jgi:hypothetical protein
LTAVRLRNGIDIKGQVEDAIVRMDKKGIDSFKTEEIFGKRN